MRSLVGDLVLVRLQEERDPLLHKRLYNALLQQALVDYLRVSRGVHCQSDQILITEGIHQAIDLVTRMLCDNGDLAWVEEPSYWGIRHVLAMNDVRAEPLTVDANGLCPPETVDDAPRLIFVTPSHQYPLGAVMSLERRQRLLALARQQGSWIVEDDYDSEFRFSGQPIPALQGLVADAPVVYIGTFSKTLYPGLRLGYVVIPRPLVSDLKHAHAELYRGGHSLIQMALAEFITAGHYSAHIRRMRLLYSRRRRRKTKRPNLRRGVIGEPDIRYQAGVAYQASIAARSFFMAFFSS